MKRVLLPLLLMLLAVGCQREEAMPEATSAAKEIYLQYAGRKDLTVALIGDYQGYNAVMLQAQDKEGWLRLCEEFGVKKNIDANALDTTKVSSLTSVKKLTYNFDSVGSVGEAMGRMIDSILNEAMQSGTVSKKVIIDTAYTIKHRELYDHGILVDSSTSFCVDSILKDNRLLNIAQQHGDKGYLIHDDSDNLTLWLFFYNTMDEFEQIINNITLIHTRK